MMRAGPRPRQRGGFHVLLLPLRQRDAAGGTGVQRPLHDHQGQHHVEDPLAEDRQQDQRHQDGREAQLKVHHAHDERIRTAAVVGGVQADQGPEAQGDQHRDEGHPEADAQAVEDGAQHVAALIVGAQPVGHQVPLRPAGGGVRVNRTPSPADAGRVTTRSRTSSPVSFHTLRNRSFLPADSSVPRGRPPKLRATQGVQWTGGRRGEGHPEAPGAGAVRRRGEP